MQTDAVAELIQEVCDRVIMPRFRALRPDEITDKRPGDPVTVADREAEALLTDAFRRATPGALVAGEEAAFDDPGVLDGLAEADLAWVIDPVDGTRNFARGSDDFGVMVAEVRRGLTTRGWIWQPRHDALWIAERGAGATRNGEQLPSRHPVADPARVGAGRHARALEVPGVTWRWTHGACAVDYPAVATGGLDGLVYRSLNPWDHLPGALLVSECGGVARVGGRPYGAGVGGPYLVAAATDAVGTVLERGLEAG